MGKTWPTGAPMHANSQPSAHSNCTTILCVGHVVNPAGMAKEKFITFDLQRASIPQV
ncbi:MAG: hypothetical protein ACRCU5_03150 [Rhizobiaceae bacterium]